MAISRYRCDDCLCWWIGDEERAPVKGCLQCGCTDNITSVQIVDQTGLAEILITKLDDILDELKEVNRNTSKHYNTKGEPI